MASVQQRRLDKADRGDSCTARTSPKSPSSVRTRVRSGLLAASHQAPGSVGLVPLLFRNLAQWRRMRGHPEPPSMSAKPAVVSVR